MGKNWGNKEINHKYVLTACRKYQKWLLRVKNCFWEMRKGGTGVFCESQGERGGSGSRMSLKWWGLQSVRLGIYPLAKAESKGQREMRKHFRFPRLQRAWEFYTFKNQWEGKANELFWDRYHYEVHSGFKLLVLLPRPPRCWPEVSNFGHPSQPLI